MNFQIRYEEELTVRVEYLLDHQFLTICDQHIRGKLAVLLP